MQQSTFHILSDATAEQEHLQVRLSFKRFIRFIEEKAGTSKTLKAKFYQFILRYFHQHPEMELPIPLDEVDRYSELLDLLDASLLPVLEDEEEALWALSLPNSDAIFHSTPAFKRLMAPGNPNGMAAAATEAEIRAFSNSLDQLNYALILERFYGIKPVQQEVVYVWTDKQTSLPRYFSIQVDNRFVEVYQKERSRPINSKTAVQQHLRHVESLCQMEGMVRMADYVFEGFSIVTASDITVRHALHKMRSAIIRHEPDNFETTYKTILSLLQALCGNPNLQFGLLPFLKVNDHLVAFYTNYFHSIAINLSREQQVPESAFLNWISHYFQQPQVVLYHGEYMKKKDTGFQKAFHQAGLKGYAALPIYHNNELAGMLELSTTSPNALDKKLLSVLEPAMPILAQLMHNHQNEFKTSLDGIIKMNFTAIQPSVQWKFNEVAWAYLKSRYENGTSASNLATIRFDEVFPLYGAIDIRNSTNERNNALYKDVQHYFGVLKQVLKPMLAHKHFLEPASQLLKEAADLQSEMGLYIAGSEATVVMQLMDKVKTFLEPLRQDPAHQKATDKYFKAVDPESGSVYEQRRALEQSMQLINSSINQYLELMQSEVQQSYPVFFEKFRTDGVEYDMYVGASINPQIPYQPEQVVRLQQLQLASMAAISKMVHLQAPHRKVPLQTTQLIFVNSGTIDISFRNDEKRFDVEGGYNIRYHIVKKRIDKVHVKETGERLTQPGKIAIVYSLPAHREAYSQYIVHLQRDGLLEPEVEELDLEDLQGVSGLKALRVSVVM
jgi:hypothetical protein